MKPIRTLLPLAFVLAACGPSTHELATQTADSATAIAAAWTSTPTVTSSATTTATASPTATVTLTATPARTATPTQTNTPANTNTPTQPPPPPPTATFTPAPTQPAPVFASSPIHAWSRDDFAHETVEVGNTLDGYLRFYRDRVVLNNQQGWCTSVWDFHKELQGVRAAYGSDVPAEWYGLYSEYRNLIHQANNINQIVRDNCPNIEASIYKEGAEARIAQLEAVFAQIQVLSGKIAAMP